MPVVWTIRHHTLAWVGLAGLALAYLAGLYVFHAEGVPPRAAADAGAAGIETLRGEIAILSRRLDRLKGDEEALRKRIATLEAAFGPTTASLPPGNAESGIISGARQNAIARATPAREPVSVTYAPLPGDGFGDLMIDRSPLPVANAGQANKTMFGVELGSGETADALQKRWAELGAQHKGLLGGLQARHQTGGSEQGAMRLIAGPIPNAAEAAQLCASLRAAGTVCKQAVFAGDSFE